MLTEKIKGDCCGCRACLQVCAKEAIRFSVDGFGFEYPEIDSSKCVNCSKCEKVCPILNAFDRVTPESGGILCGAARAKDEDARFSGSSGGLFGVFARRMISEGGTVFGASFDGSLRLKTTKVSSVDSLAPLFKSKYLLCDTSGAFGEIRNELENGRKVLYCSSPCQIFALKRFLSKEYENLLTVDFVCHGVGNQKMFTDSVEWFGKKHRKKLSGFVFRYKHPAKATSHYFKAIFADGSERSGMYFDFPYYNAYCKKLACRDICYKCPFASKQRGSDITIGDFHTVEKYIPGIDRMGGISMYLCGTPKGKAFFENVSGQLDLWDITSQVLYSNNRFSDSEKVDPVAVEAFRKAYAQNGFTGPTLGILDPASDKLKKIFYRMPGSVRKLIMRTAER